MTAELNASVSKLRSLSPKFNQAAEQASRTMQAVEKFLDECKAGLTCYAKIWSKTPDHDQCASDDDYEGLFLGYDRVNGKFRIVICEHELEWNDHIQADKIVKTTTPWSDAARGLKLETFRVLPTLLEILASLVEQTIKATGDTAATVDQVLTALAAPSGSMDMTPEQSAAVRQVLQETKPGGIKLRDRL